MLLPHTYVPSSTAFLPTAIRLRCCRSFPGSNSHVRQRRCHVRAALPEHTIWHETLTGRAVKLLGHVVLGGMLLCCDVSAQASPTWLLPPFETGAGGTTSELLPDALHLLPIPTEFPPAPELRLPRYKQETLSNGLRVFLLEDHELPLVRGTLLMRGGQYASPPDKIGLATMSASVQRAGGTTAHPAAVLDERLEELAAAVEAAAGQQALSLDFTSLKDDLSEVFGLFCEVLRTPALPEERVRQYQAQITNVMQHRYDAPGAIPRRELQKLIYGPDSLYARSPTYDMITAITRDDIRAYLDKWERPDAAVLGVVGDFDSAAMLQLVQEQLGSWAPAAGQPAEPFPEPTAPEPTYNGAGTVFLVDRPESTQAVVALGEPGIRLSDPDSYALDVLSSIFNSFGGRLFDEVRSREGLAYSVAGGWDIPPDHTGVFVAGGETSAPAEFLAVMRRVLQQATEQLPSQDDLDTAKAQTLNSFVFNFSSPVAQLQRILVYDLLQLPQDYLFQYKAGIESVTAEDVLAAARRHLHPDRQTIVVAGNVAVVRPSLEGAGFKVQLLNLDMG